MGSDVEESFVDCVVVVEVIIVQLMGRGRVEDEDHLLARKDVGREMAQLQ
jgi:hypothetical protein